MNKMIKTLAGVFLIIMLFSNAYAIEVTDISTSLEANNTQITKLNAELNAKMQQMDVKLDKFATKEDVTLLLNQHLAVVNQVVDNFRSALIVSFIIIGICLIGLGYSVYFYFKGKRRL